METPPIRIDEVVRYLQTEFATERYPQSEQGGIYRPSNRMIQKLALALEPGPGLTNWIVEHRCDALYLHRPWQLDLASLPPHVGVLYHHLPFDETLTIGYNTRLARALGAVGLLQPLGHKQATNEAGELLPRRAIGMLFTVDEQAFDTCLKMVKECFGGYDRAQATGERMGHETPISRIAVVGAMNDALIREAAERGAQVYLTGQYRKPAQEAVDETGIAVIAVGHRRSEEWGLRALADMLRERWPGLQTVVG